nr:MAG TPA: hypothetical protein [Caudoviricetes sp.]
MSISSSRAASRSLRCAIRSNSLSLKVIFGTS